MLVNKLVSSSESSSESSSFESYGIKRQGTKVAYNAKYYILQVYSELGILLAWRIELIRDVIRAISDV